MKEKIFNIDSPFFRTMSLIGDMMLLNLMWLVTSLPLVTIGASTTALLYTGMKLAKGRDGYVVRNFWKAFCSNFGQATGIYLLLLAIGGGIGYAGWYWMHQDGMVAQVLAIGAVALLILWLIEVLFVFAVQAKFQNTIGNTMKNALVMGIQNLPLTLLCAVAWALLAGLNYTFVVANVLTLVIGMGVLGWVLGMFYNLAFRRYLPKEKDERESEWEENCDEESYREGNNGEFRYAEYADKEAVGNSNIK